ncbi:hypothetical protein AB4Y95_02350 [Arthrobacter sp. M-10]
MPDTIKSDFRSDPNLTKINEDLDRLFTAQPEERGSMEVSINERF